MIRRLCLLAAVTLFSCLPAHSQFLGDRVDLSAEYSYMRFRSTPQANRAVGKLMERLK